MTGGLIVTVIASLLGMISCEVGTPFRGPGVAATAGQRSADGGAEVAVALTHAKVDWFKRGAFDDYTMRVVNTIEQNDGLIGYSVRRQLLGVEVWTMTVWRDEASLDAFVNSPMHREAIRKGMPAVVEAQFHRMRWPISDLPPSWDAMKRVLKDVPTRSYGGS